MKKIIAMLFIMGIMCSQIASATKLEEAYENSSTNAVKLNSQNAILYDKTYQTVLYEKRAHERVPNASTTKMLTAIVAYENANIEDLVPISKKAANTTGSVIGLKSGDIITLGDLIKGLLVRSGNDTAIAIAEFVGGDVEQFAEMLNQKAKEMGLQNTHFVTPHGLDAEEHYSSAYDLVKIAEYLLNIDYLANIVKQQIITIQVNHQSRNLTTTNEMLALYDGANGVKTGYTANAGRCLVTSCTKEGRTLIAVVLGCGTKGQRTSDSKTLLNYGFQQFELVDICQKMQKKFVIFVDKSQDKQYQLIIDKSIFLPIEKESQANIHYQYFVPSRLEAPIYPNTKIGSIKIYLNQTLLRELEIYSPCLIHKKGVLNYMEEILLKSRKNMEISL